MSYTPTNWQTGDTVTAERLNKMEQGIEKNAGYWIPVQYSSGTFSVPADKVDEVLYALHNPSYVFINGAVINGGGFHGGYRVDGDKFYCPLSAEEMEANGMSGTGNIIIKHAVGVEDVSVEVVPDTFIITLTPTAEDFSGTHDRTVAEISAAVLSHKKIVFEMDASSIGIPSLRFDANVAQDNSTHENEFSAKGLFVFTGFNSLVLVETDKYEDGFYSTVAYPLTPMS